MISLNQILLMLHALLRGDALVLKYCCIQAVIVSRVVKLNILLLATAPDEVRPIL